MKRVKNAGINLYEVYIDVYDKYFYVCFGEEEYKKVLKFFGVDEDTEQWNYNDFRGMLVADPESEKLVLIFQSAKRDYQDSDVIGHECIHLLYYILNQRNIEFNFNNQEPVAYLMGFIQEKVNEIFDAERKRLKKKK